MINPGGIIRAGLLIAFVTVIGAIVGYALWGLAAGLAAVIVANMVQ